MLKSFEVDNISCNGCASTIRSALSEHFGDVVVDLTCEPRKVTLDIENQEDEMLFRTILRKLGYPLSDETLGNLKRATLKAKSTLSCAVGRFNQNENPENISFSLKNKERENE